MRFGHVFTDIVAHGDRQLAAGSRGWRSAYKLIWLTTLAGK